jgi:hypothetical protein
LVEHEKDICSLREALSANGKMSISITSNEYLPEVAPVRSEHI